MLNAKYISISPELVVNQTKQLYAKTTQEEKNEIDGQIDGHVIHKAD